MSGMNTPLLIIAALCVTLTRAAGQFPSGVPVNDGIFSSILDAPYFAEVSELRTTATSFSVRLTRENQVSSTYARSSNVQNLESEFVAGLKAGQRYRFPQCVIDILGLEKTLAVVRTRPGIPLSQFTSEIPFRAVVLDQGIGENTYSIILQETGGRLHHLQGVLNEPNMHPMAISLSRGRTYEFPAMIEDALLSREERLAKSKPKTPHTAVLQLYLGVWRGHLDDNPAAQIEMTCHPRADGDGIWREIKLDMGSHDVPPAPAISIVEYDRMEKSYRVYTLPPGDAPPLSSSWDESTKTFTAVLPNDDQGHRRINTVTFTRDDRIDWKTITQNGKGGTTSAISGHYERLRTIEEDETEPLPPSSYTASITLPFTMRTVPALPSPEPPYWTTLAGLSSSPPFRARLTSLVVTDNTLSLQLLHTNGAYNTRTEIRPGIGESDLGKALSRLNKGEVYEFPHCLDHPDQKEADQPDSPEMKALEPFIGTWSGKVRNNSGKPGPIAPAATVRYFWSADGKALWREHASASGNTKGVNGPSVTRPGRTTLTRISYDPATREYVETNENPAAYPASVRAAWDAEKRSYTWKGGMGRSPETNGSGTRTFNSPDLIEWQSREFKTDGTLLQESSGTYERIKP